jgi:carbonic anhydrase
LAQLAQLKKSATASRQVSWEYAGSKGPGQWGQLSTAYKLCQEGFEQSPINIPGNWPTEQTIELDYKESIFKVKDNSRSIELIVERGNFATIRGIRYELQNISFHTPSEHLIENRSHLMEVQLIHASAQGELAIIAVFISSGESQQAYQRVIDHLPSKVGEIVRPNNVSLNLRQMLPDELSSFYYMGSQTTPPCAEQVAWHVLSKNVKLSLSQIDHFKAKYLMNARPIQPLNYRRAP